jgi:hypothetical protein
MNIRLGKFLQSYVFMHKMECIDLSKNKTFIKVKQKADL